MNKKVLCLIISIFMVLFISNVSAKEIDSNLTLTEDLKESIVVKAGSKVTLDLAGFNIINTKAEHTILVEKGATLTIKGEGKVTNDSNGKAVIANEGGTVTIENGTFSRIDATGNSFYVILNHGDMTIDGGTFETTNGISSLIDNGWYTPSENTEKRMANMTINDGTFNMTANDKYIKNDDYGVMTVNGGTFNMNVPSSAVIANIGFASGKETLTIKGGIFNYYHTKYAIWDKDWSEKYTDNSVTLIYGGTFNLTNSEAKITNVKLGTPESEVKQYPVLGEDNKFVIADESELTKKIEVNSAIESSLPEEDVNLAKEKAGKEYSILGYFDINLYNTFDDTVKVEKISENDEKVKVTLPKPANLPTLEDGFTRTYYIVRVHNGVAELIEATLNEDGTISFYTDKFSTYALTYKDVKAQTTTTTNPNTADNVLVYTSVVAISVLGIAGTVVYSKKRMF